MMCLGVKSPASIFRSFLKRWSLINSDISTLCEFPVVATDVGIYTDISMNVMLELLPNSSRAGQDQGRGIPSRLMRKKDMSVRAQVGMGSRFRHIGRGSLE